MGAYIHDRDTLHVLAQLNLRFSAGDEIEEMAALQGEFDIFSEKHKLRDAFAALNIGPDRPQRRNWYRFLDDLRKYKSDTPRQNGHDRIVTALRDNLESKSPLPVYFTVHAAAENAGVRVDRGMPVAFAKEKHLIISIPTTPAKRRGAASGRAKGRRKQA